MLISLLHVQDSTGSTAAKSPAIEDAGLHYVLAVVSTLLLGNSAAMVTCVFPLGNLC